METTSFLFTGTAYRPLENIDLRDYMVNLEGEGHGLYLHLPFCESKCGYCNLFSVTGCSQAHMDAYLEGVVRQMRQYREILPGSTPQKAAPAGRPHTAAPPCGSPGCPLFHFPDRNSWDNGWNTHLNTEISSWDRCFFPDVSR